MLQLLGLWTQVCLSCKHGPMLLARSLWPLVTSASKAAYRFPLLCGLKQVRRSASCMAFRE